MSEIDSISIKYEGGEWVLRITIGQHYAPHRFAIGDPGQFLEETQRTLGRWLAEDQLIRAMYAQPVEPQSIRADLEENQT